MIEKSRVYNQFRTQIEDKISSAQSAYDEATESMRSETKGSAGDKHETGRSMAQIEVENLAKILTEAQQLQSIFNLLEPDLLRTRCEVGALVGSLQGLFYLSTGIGKIMVGEKIIFCIAMNSPLGQAMIGKRVGEDYSFLGKDFKILEIS